MSEEQKQQLEKQLWDIANTLRGKMNADEFRDYILGFIFYKYLSEKLLLFANNLLEKDKLGYQDLNYHSREIEKLSNSTEYLEAIKTQALNSLGYFLKPSELFHSVAMRGTSGGSNSFILEDLQKILSSIEQSTLGTKSEDDFDNLFEDLDLASTKLGRTVEARNELIAKVLFHLDKIDFKLEDSKIDVLGDAYEYLIGQFAAGAGKKAGEFYTPQEVSTILARIVTAGKKRLKNVYDPTCGSGSLLLRVAKEVEDVGEFVGQELNRTTYNLARMNMILHDVHYESFDIRQEDTLEAPQHIDRRFEAVVANPPFSAKWSASQRFMSDDRFSQFGKLPPKSKADYAFVLHMIHSLDDNGTMAVVMPHGVLFRGAAEAHIRQHLIKNLNYLDAVIGLPANIFYGTSIPTCILIFKKCRKTDDNIFFIDASKEFQKAGNRNKLLEEHIDKIVNAYSSRESIKKFSHAAQLSEIEDNEYNLNIPRYVDTFEEEEPINLAAVAKELKEINQQILTVDKKIQEFTKELNIEDPF